MLVKRARSVLEKRWVRVAVAAVLLFAGMAQAGAPILSGNAPGGSQGSSAGTASLPAFLYRYTNGPDGTAQVQRSQVGSSDWTTVSTIHAPILQLANLVSSGHQTLFARTAGAIWRSADGGSTWSAVSGLPGRPLSMAVAPGTADLVLVGTDSSGLYVSSDQGTSWRHAGGPLSSQGAGTVAVSAVTVNPTDELVSYAIAGYTMAAPDGEHTLQAVYVSVDGARHWFPMATDGSTAADGATGSLGPDTRLVPVAGRLLAVSAVGQTGTGTFELGLGPELLGGLQASDAGLRAAAAQALGLTGDAGAVAPLLSHVKDPDQAVGDSAAQALGHLGDQAAVSALRADLSDSNEAVRARAANALGLLKDTASIPALVTMLINDGPLARGSAASGLAAMGTPSAVAALVDQLSGSDQAAQPQLAMQALEEVGAPAVAPVVEALQSAETPARRNAAELLGYMAPQQAVPALAQALNDPDSQVREQAAWALGQIGTVPAQEALARTMASAPDNGTRQAATQAFAQAQASSSQRAPIQLTLGPSAMRALSQIPAGRWTFLVLLATLAAALLFFRPPAARKMA
jgi:HEAT repeat protein